MQNQIEEIREQISQHFEESGLLPDSEEINYSPDKKYYFTSKSFKLNIPELNWIIAKIEIFDVKSGLKIYEFLRSDDTICFCWIEKGPISYLILSEYLEGQSIYDLTNRQFYGFYNANDTFIWCDFFPSPDKRFLTVFGCYWACPYELKVYDFSNPQILPFKEIFNVINLKASNEDVKWINETTFLLNDSKGNSQQFDLDKDSI